LGVRDGEFRPTRDQFKSILPVLHKNRIIDADEVQRVGKLIDELSVNSFDSSGKLIEWIRIEYKKSLAEPLSVFPFFFIEPIFDSTPEYYREGTNEIAFFPGGHTADKKFAFVIAIFDFGGSMPREYESVFEGRMNNNHILDALRRELTIAIGTPVETWVDLVI